MICCRYEYNTDYTVTNEACSDFSIAEIYSTGLDPAHLATTATNLTRLKVSILKKAPKTRVNSPLRLLKIVTLLTEVCARAALMVTFAENQTAQNMSAIFAVSRTVSG